jgi:putative transposase
MENGFMESLHGKLRDDCLSLRWFKSLADTEEKIKRQRRGYKTERPHGHLGDLLPHKFIERTTLPG